MSKTALIIAPDDNGLEPVLNIPNVRRLILLATRLGFGDIHLIGEIDAFVPVVSDLLPSSSLHSAAELSQLDNLLHQMEFDKQKKVLILKADIVIDRLSLAEFLEAGRNEPIARMKLAPDGNPAGIYLTRPVDLAEIAKILWSPELNEDEVSLQAVQDFSGRDGLPRLVRKEEKANTRMAEEKLIGSLSAQTAQSDGFMSRHFDRRISQFFSKRLVRTKITPNQVTLIGVSIGLTAALLFSFPGYWPHLLGSLLFVFCVIVDGVDGEVARLKLLESRFGHYLDITTDNLVHVAVFVGMAFGLYNSTGNRLYLWALWFLLAGFGLSALAVYRFIKRGDSEAFKQSPRLMRLMKMMNNRDFAYLIVFLALIDRLEWFLLGSAIGTYVFAGLLWFLSAKADAKQLS